MGRLSGHGLPNFGRLHTPPYSPLVECRWCGTPLTRTSRGDARLCLKPITGCDRHMSGGPQHNIRPTKGTAA
jgi:hypothetical protein